MKKQQETGTEVFTQDSYKIQCVLEFSLHYFAVSEQLL